MNPELTRPPRANQGIGVAFMLLGGAAMAFSAFALFMTLLQELMAAAIPASDDFDAMGRALWTVWRLHMPIWFVGGVGFVICGKRLRAHRAGAVVLARLACVLAVVALVAYGADTWIRVMPVWEPLFEMDPMLPAGWFRYFMAASTIITLGMVTVPFGALLWGLRTRTR